MEENEDQQFLRVNTPTEFLAALPLMLEFVPRNCLVVVGYSGNAPQGIGHFDIRNDAETVINVMIKSRNITRWLLVAYTDHDDRVMEYGQKLVEVAVPLMMAVRGPADGWVVTPTQFVKFPEIDSHPISELDEVRERLGIAERMPTKLIEDGVEPVPVNTDIVKEVATIMLRKTADVMASPAKRPTDYYEPNVFIELLERGLRDRESLTLDDIVELVMILNENVFRDLAIVQIGTDKETAIEFAPRHLAGIDDAEGDPEPEHQVAVGVGMRPPRRRLENAIDLMRSLSSHVDGSSWTVNLMSIAAWSAWASGQSSRALALAKYARAAKRPGDGIPDEHLCDTLIHAIAHNTLPDWAYDEEL